ncbi:class I SAM-dependent methyltransferase [Amycolatopsis sp.]|uniref:class I SAM-dependent methyltransferase n=1 Tax=Amycolatopsis sp. TaxID=37632 RepID=UPI002CFEB68E|nr:class I SAM-dependent methyltransferase [Amycolatopsis sp.]HVV12574.1 class I SAM-dependent methyltransferase [Amycolatopsis sp.]
MTTSTETSPDQVMERIVTELGAGLGILLTALGIRHGLWAALAGAGPLDTAEVTARTGLTEPYVREWLRSQAAAGYLEYHAGADAFSLPEPVEVAMLRAPGGAIVDACAHMLASMGATFADLEKAFLGGSGFGWHQRDPEHWAGTDALTRCSLDTELLAAAIDDLPGVREALRAGGTVADVGCGYGAPTRMIAQACPAATVVGFDYHDRSIAAARAAAADSEVAGRVRFEVASASDFPGHGYGLVTFVDSLHDLGDPVGALVHARQALAPDGAVLLVEPPGGDRVADNLNPTGRMFYAVSFLVCTPNALSQSSTAPLGTLAGAPALGEVAAAAGFRTVRPLAVDAPMNLLLELRP